MTKNRNPQPLLPEGPSGREIALNKAAHTHVIPGQRRDRIDCLRLPKHGFGFGKTQLVIKRLAKPLQGRRTIFV